MKADSHQPNAERDVIDEEGNSPHRNGAIFESQRLSTLLESLENGGRPKGGAGGIEDGIPSIGGEHLTRNGGFNFTAIRFIPEEYYLWMKKGRIRQHDILMVKEGQAQVLSTYHGAAQGGIKTSFAEKVSLPIPSMGKQREVVRFLDFFDMRIGRFIHSRRRLVELLNEQKLITIQTVITRGPEQEADLKKSRVAWIGNIPGYWTEKRAKFYLREIDERSETGAEELLSVSHITGVTPRSQKNVTMFKAASYAGHKLCRPGDLVVNTMWAWMGALGVAKQNGLVSPSYAVYRISDNTKFVPDYLDYLLRIGPYRSEYACRSTGIRPSRLRLYPEQFLQIPLIQPPRAQQKQIVDRIRERTREFDSAISVIKREIDLVSEYRMGLISNVTAGKLDIGDGALTNIEEDAIPKISEPEPCDKTVESTLDEESDAGQ